VKSLKEKKMLARLSRNAGQPDLALEESIRREEELAQKLFKEDLEQKIIIDLKVEPTLNPKMIVQEAEVPVDEESLVQKAVEAIHNAKPPMGEIPKHPLPDLSKAELKGLHQKIEDINRRIGTLSFGGGGTGVVRFDALDDARTIYLRMDSKVYTFLQDTPPLLANGADQWINTASGLEYTNINEGMMVIPTWVEFGPALTQNVADPEPVWFNYPFTAVTADNYAVANSDFYIGVNYDGNVAITLPTQPEVANGHTCVIKDESGNASGATNWIDIYASGTDKIDGQDFVRLQIDHGSLTFFYRDGWRII
jgi:hypothetical protein